MTLCGNPLSRSLLGVERTWRFLQRTCLLLTQSGHAQPLQARFPAISLLFWGAPERRRVAWQLQFLAGVGNFRAADMSLSRKFPM